MTELLPPNPGTKEAIDAGCTCPVLDNYHGRGIPMDGEIVFWYTEGCTIHFPKEEKESSDE
jgi:hypothetical protein